MGFKLRQPIKIDPVARYEVPFTPDNIPDDSGLVARANDNGNMIVNKNIPKDSKLRKVAESHEDHHLRDIMDGKLAYDEKAVYHNMDGKGMKKTPRSEFSESDKNLAWEKPAYKAGEDREEKDMRPKKDKLNRSSEVSAGKFAFAFREMNKPMRTQDQETVSMSENFGTAMVKKFGIGPQKSDIGSDSDISGNPSDPDKIKDQAKSNAEAEFALKQGKTTTSKRTTSSGSAADRDLVFQEFTKSTTPSRGFKNQEERDWAENNPEDYKKLIEKKREEESMREFKQMPIRENFIKVDTKMRENVVEEPCEEGYFFSEKLNKCQKKSTSTSKKRKKSLGGGKDPKQQLSTTTGNTEVCKVDDTPKEKKRKGCGKNTYTKGDARRAARKSNRRVNKSGIIKF